MFQTNTRIDPVRETARLVMQDDGNLVLYANATPIWSSWYGKMR